jgi:ABC-type thiamin/hydroxymethylpyrimidine transport system permease subunit
LGDILGRIILAFLVSPLPAAFIQSLVVAIWPKPGMGIFEHPASMFIAVCLLFYGFGLVLGVPLLLTVGKRRSPTLRGYALAGMGIVLTPVLVALVWVAARAQASAWSITYNIAFFAIGGLLAGALFWLVARPDRKAAAADGRRLASTFGDQPDG